jgi:squalene-hopene/tetraprenyl-beta-curcumene cyclase
MTDTTLAPPSPALNKLDALEPHISAATDAILAEQKPDGHWVYELEADATIPAEYVLLKHFLGEPAPAEVEAKIAVYLRRIQGDHGGWPLFREGDFDMSASVKAYFALKMIGDDINAPHMTRAREAILSRGGGIKSNVFTRALLSLFGVLRWKCAGDAGRDHAAAEVVSVPPRQGLVLGAHRDRAAAGAAGAQAEGSESARRDD